MGALRLLVRYSRSRPAWVLGRLTPAMHGCMGGIRRIQTLFLSLSKHKIFRYFMHMRAKTICGFALIVKSLYQYNDLAGSYPTFDP